MAKALGRIGDDRAIKPLFEHLDDNDDWVRDEVEAALETIDPDWRSVVEASAAVPALLERLYYHDEDVQAAAAFALGAIGDARAVAPLMTRVVIYLREIRAETEKSQWAGYYYSDLSRDVRMEAATALGKIIDPHAVKLLMFLRDEDLPIVGSRAASALEKIDLDWESKVVSEDPDESGEVESLTEHYFWSPEDIKRAMEGAEGKNVSASVDALISTLGEAQEWGRVNGWPVHEEYPHYEDIRSIGKSIFEEGEFGAMQRAYYYVEARDHELASLLNHFWHSVGGWMA